MDATTAAVLRAVADLHAHGQAHATDTRGLRRLVRARGQAIDAWVRAGCPDLDGDRPAIMPRAMRRDEEDDE